MRPEHSLESVTNGWLPPPAQPALAASDVHVWRTLLDQHPATVARLAGLLSADEVERANRFRFASGRSHFVVARGVLRTLLAAYVDVLPDQLRFAYSSYGKPVLDLPGAAAIGFNVSHADGLALFAIARSDAVGVDVEAVRDMLDAEQLAQRFFSPTEYDAIQRLPYPQRKQAFFTCWTRKEAYTKARGEGLSFPFNEFEVSLLPEEPAQLLAVQGDPHEARRWSMHALDPQQGYVASLAIKGHNWQLARWHWP